MGFAARADRSYRQLLERLFASRRFGVDLGLARIEALATALGSPQERIRTRVVVAGTNGKGSTAAFLEAIAVAAGRRVGTFSSPHLSRFAERFRLDGNPASERDIVTAAERVSAAGGDELTFFEQCMGIALALFDDASVDFGIFEVGLGGRLDATRAACGQLVVVTGVAFDHQEVLGDTLEAIANEKVAAAPPLVPLILGRGGAPGSLPALIAATARQGHEDVEIAADSTPHALGLRGRFQQANAACAVAAARRLGIAEELVGRGLAAATLAGRFEVVMVGGPAAPEVIVDGAHNGAGAAALASALAELPARETIVVLGVSADKGVEDIVAPLGASAAAIWITSATSDRAMPAVELERRVRAHVAGVPTEIVSLADIASRIASDRRPLRIVATGSMILIGELRSRLLGERSDAIALSDPPALRNKKTDPEGPVS